VGVEICGCRPWVGTVLCSVWTLGENRRAKILQA
jgi:hypothetical protein